MGIFSKKKPEWVLNLEYERLVLTESLTELEGLSEAYQDTLRRIEFINKILSDEGYDIRKKGINNDTKLIVGSQLLQSVWYSYCSEILGRIVRIDPFHIKTRFK